jgi:hypothetical protein
MPGVSQHSSPGGGLRWLFPQAVVFAVVAAVVAAPVAAPVAAAAVVVAAVVVVAVVVAAVASVVAAVASVMLGGTLRVLLLAVCDIRVTTVGETCVETS